MNAMIKKLYLLILTSVILSMSATSLVSAETKQEITVSAAISLKNVFEEAGKLYEARNKGIKVVFNFGASGDLIRQIEVGAPVDVFASAAQKDMDEISGKGLTGRFCGEHRSTGYSRQFRDTYQIL